MKSPTDYLLSAWQPDPEHWPEGGVPYVPQAQAERAIEQALADAEKYKYLLLRAALNARAVSPQQPQP